MQPKKVWAVYFSGTGTTEKTVRRIASGLSTALSAPMEVFDFTPPAARQDDLSFGPEDLVVPGVPTYAGRVPNVLLPQAKGWRKKNVYTNQQSHQLVGRGRMGTASDHLNPVHRMSLNNPLRCSSNQTSQQSTQVHD